MSLPALQLLEREFEKQKRFFELRKHVLGRKIGRQIERLELHKGAFEKTIERRLQQQRRKIEQGFESLDDDVRFIRTWLEKPLSLGAVTPSSKALASRMAAYVDPKLPGTVVELGAGTGAITDALVARGIAAGRLVLVESDATFCRLLRGRYPAATVLQGDAYGLKGLLAGLLQEPAAAVVSGLPLFTKPMKTRLRLLFEAFAVMAAGAPFVQFTYNTVPPIPTRLDRVRAQSSERVWKNIPPARVWVYRRD